MPRQLYLDIVLMIKNVYFCITKMKVDNPSTNFYLILLRMDHLETFSGLSVLQSHASELMEVVSILAEHPEWDYGTCCLSLPVFSKETQEFTSKANHITPRDWHGNVSVANVNLHTCWLLGQQQAEDLIPDAEVILSALSGSIDMLAPFGELLVNLHDKNLDKAKDAAVTPDADEDADSTEDEEDVNDSDDGQDLYDNSMIPPPSLTLPLPGGPPLSPSVLNLTSTMTKALTPSMTAALTTALTNTQHTQHSGPLRTSTQAITSTSMAETPTSVTMATCNPTITLASQIASTSTNPMPPPAMASTPVFPFTMALELSPAMSATQLQAPSTAFMALSNLMSASKTAAPQPQCSPSSSMPDSVIDT
ncbi:hypothetical protein EDB89DRAFT_2071449 [Lactarius sanguifluus]|nr:hypothetical protein EDB89DRAFT_2071449 [Lactarius sanguifluus]